MLGQAVEEATEHRAVRVVDRVLDRRRRPGGNPRRIAHDQRCPALREEVRLHDLHPVAVAEPVEVRPRAGEGFRVDLRRDDLLDAAVGEDGGQHAGAGADVERLGERGQRGVGDEVDVLAANR